MGKKIDVDKVNELIDKIKVEDDVMNKHYATMIGIMADAIYSKTGDEWYKRVADQAREIAEGE